MIGTRRLGVGTSALTLALMTAVFFARPVVTHAFGLADVAAKAAQLAKQPFDDTKNVPDWLLKMSYDQWRDIRYRPDAALRT